MISNTLCIPLILRKRNESGYNLSVCILACISQIHWHIKDNEQGRVTSSLKLLTTVTQTKIKPGRN
jgi:hypothetical protein